MNNRLRLLLILGTMVVLVVTLAGCNRERPATTNDKGTPAPGRATVAAPVGTTTPAGENATGNSRAAQSETPTAPDPQAIQTSPTSASGSGASATGEGSTYTVVAGDNLAAIAARFGTTVDALSRLNNIANPNSLTLGQVLKIPGTAAAGSSAAAPTASAPGASAALVADGTYTIQPGDTLSRVAQQFNTTSAALAALNGITNPDQIKVGQTLKIPGAGSTTAETDQSTTGDGTTHVIAQGETLGMIAKRYGVTVKQIQDANNIANPDRVYVGQKLVIP